MPVKGLAVILTVICLCLGFAGEAKAQTLSGEKKILSFSFPFIPGAGGIIDQTSHTIIVTVPYSVSLTNLVATFTHSPSSNVQVGGIDQISGVTTNNFTIAVVYVVIAENLETQNYVVSVSNAPKSNACFITSFSFADLIPAVEGVINQNTGSINLVVPFGTTLNSLAATFDNSPYSLVTIDAAEQESGVTVNNFSSDKTYRVTAENGIDYKDYEVQVTMVPAARGNSILTFAFKAFDPDVTGVIDEGAKTIRLTVPFGTNPAGLVPTFTSSPLSTVTVSGSVQSSGITPQDFTGPVDYKCISQDGSEEIYTVTVLLALPATANKILSFGFEDGFDPVVTGTINETLKTITLIVPFSTVLTAVKATFTNSPLSLVFVGDIPQVSGVTPNDFTSNVSYTCKAQDGSSEIYTVTVTRAPVQTGNDLLEFGFTGLAAPPIVSINQLTRAVSVIVPYSTPLTGLSATFTVSPYSSVTVLGAPQTSGITANDFSAPVIYTVTAENGVSKEYTVLVSRAPAQTGKEITAFGFNALTPPVSGFIDQAAKTIILLVPGATDVTSLIATFTASPLSTVFVGSDIQTSGVTPNSFTEPKVYTVRSEQGSLQAYTVIVNKIPLSSAKEMVDFRFTTFDPDAIGLINQEARSIVVEVPYPADITSLAATFTSSPHSTVQIGAILQFSGITENDFSSGILYDVFAEDGSVTHYTVMVNIVALPKRFLSYSFQSSCLIAGDEVTFTAYGTINDLTRTITVNIPFSASKNNLKALFTLTGNTSAFIGGTGQISGVTANDFTNPKTYFLQASDGSVTNYEVIVTNNPISREKQIVSFRFNGLTPSVGGVIDERGKGITAILPYGTNLHSLVASFETTSSLTRIKINGVRQVSGTTFNDFSAPLVYRCISEDGSFVEYTVTASAMPASSAREITDFRFNGLTAPAIGTISEAGGTITVLVPWGSDVTRLVATFTISPLSAAYIGSSQQFSSVTANNFSSTLMYSVRAENGLIRNYLVTVTKIPPSNRKAILSFHFETQFDPDIIGVIDEEKRLINVTVPFSQDVTALTASFVTSPYALIYVGDNLQISGHTVNNFTGPVTYACRAEDGSVALYTVHVSHAPVLTSNELLTFRFNGLDPDAIGLIDQDNFTVTVRLPFSQSATGLVASFDLSPMARAYVGGVLQSSGLTANNFTNPVVYSVRSESGSFRYYYINIIREAARSGNTLESFSFQGLTSPVNGVIDQPARTVTLRVPFSTNLTSLIATFEASYRATVKIGSAVQTSGVTSNDFSSGLVYTIYAEDASVQPYLVVVSKNPISPEKQISAFRFIGLSADAIGSIDEEAGLILVTVPWAADITRLVAGFSSSPASQVRVGGSVQVSGITPQNFSSPVVYQVTAENGSVKSYTVIVTRAAAATGNTIMAFNFGIQFDPDITGIIDQSSKTISLTVPYTCDITGLVSSFTCSPSATVFIGSTIQVSGSTPNNFTNPLVYVCQAEDGSTEFYTVTVNRAAASSWKQILEYSFTLSDLKVFGIIDQVNKTVKVKVPFGTDISYLTGFFTLSPLARALVGDILQVSGETPLDFSVPVLYRIIAEDGSPEYYIVTVSAGPNTENRLYHFSFDEIRPPAVGVINDLAGTISVTIPFGVSAANLAASFTSSPNSIVKVGSIVQVSGLTVNDFTTVRNYQVISESGAVRNYLVTVVIAPPATGKSILSFNFEVQFEPDIMGTIDPVTKTIRLTVPLTQDMTALIATYTSSPLSRVRVGSNYQVSGTTFNDFTGPVTYVCEAQNGLSELYTVVVTRAPASNLKDILSFRFEGLLKEAVGVIDQTGRTITVTVPGETDVTKLIATYVLSPFAIAKVGGAAQISGFTPNDFSQPVQYTIRAEDNSEKIYSVRVIAGLYSDKKILNFGFYGLTEPVEGVINEQLKAIVVYVPFAANRANLVATFSSSARSTVWIGAVQQVSGSTANDFNSVKIYTVRAEDNSTQDYLVTVLKSPALTGNQILTYRFAGLFPPVEASIEQSFGTITAVVPFGTNLTGMVATFTSSRLAMVSVGGIAQISGFTSNDFSQPLIYRCTSESGLINEYVVSVSVAMASNAKEINYFAFEELSPVCIGMIDQEARTITLEVIAGTSVNSLKAVFTNSPGSTVSIPGKGIQISGVSSNDFTLPLIYHVVAEDGSSVDYTVTVRLVADTVPPVVTNPSQLITNASGQYAALQSNEATGKVYMIRSDAPQTTVPDLDQSVSAGLGLSGLVIQADTEIRISTYTLDQGIYHTYAVDGAGNKSARGINLISIIDVLIPDVFVQEQTISNAPARFVNIRSSENSGYVYLVLEGIPRSTKQQLDAAVGARKGQKALVTGASIDVPVSTHQLSPGVYRAFAVDINGNLSDESVSAVIVTQASHLNSILAFSFNGLATPAVGQIVGKDIFVKVPAGTVLTALVAHFTLSPLARAFVGLVEQSAGATPNNFTNPIVYTVEAEDGTTSEYTVAVSYGTAVEDQSLAAFIRCYPNPVSDRLLIEMAFPADRIQVISLTGQIISDLQVRGNTVVIDTGSWMNGTYLVRFYRDGRYSGNQKVIKE